MKDVKLYKVMDITDISQVNSISYNAGFDSSDLRVDNDDMEIYNISGLYNKSFNVDMAASANKLYVTDFSLNTEQVEIDYTINNNGHNLQEIRNNTYNILGSGLSVVRLKMTDFINTNITTDKYLEKGMREVKGDEWDNKINLAIGVNLMNYLDPHTGKPFTAQDIYDFQLMIELYKNGNTKFSKLSNAIFIGDKDIYKNYIVGHDSDGVPKCGVDGIISYGGPFITDRFGSQKYSGEGYTTRSTYVPSAKEEYIGGEKIYDQATANRPIDFLYQRDGSLYGFIYHTLCTPAPLLDTDGVEIYNPFLNSDKVKEHPYPETFYMYAGRVGSEIYSHEMEPRVANKFNKYWASEYGAGITNHISYDENYKYCVRIIRKSRFEQGYDLAGCTVLYSDYTFGQGDNYTGQIGTPVEPVFINGFALDKIVGKYLKTDKGVAYIGLGNYKKAPNPLGTDALFKYRTYFTVYDKIKSALSTKGEYQKDKTFLYKINNKNNYYNLNAYTLMNYLQDEIQEAINNLSVSRDAILDGVLSSYEFNAFDNSQGLNIKIEPLDNKFRIASSDKKYNYENQDIRINQPYITGEEIAGGPAIISHIISLLDCQNVNVRYRVAFRKKELTVDEWYDVISSTVITIYNAYEILGFIDNKTVDFGTNTLYVPVDKSKLSNITYVLIDVGFDDYDNFITTITYGDDEAVPAIAYTSTNKKTAFYPQNIHKWQLTASKQQLIYNSLSETDKATLNILINQNNQNLSYKVKNVNNFYCIGHKITDDTLTKYKANSSIIGYGIYNKRYIMGL